MPRPSAKVQQARSQREISEKQGFDSGWTDDPFEGLIDPDFEPTHSEDEYIDSDDELLPRDFAFSIAQRM